MCEICSKLAVNIPERRQWRSGVLIMKFKQISLRFHKFANTLVEAARSAIFTLIHISPVLGLYTPWKHLVSIAPCEGVQKFNLWKNLVTIKQKLVVSCPFPPGRHKTSFVYWAGVPWSQDFDSRQFFISGLTRDLSNRIWWCHFDNITETQETIIYWLDRWIVSKQPDIMSTYHYVQNQGKLRMQSRENGQKPQFG